MGLVPTDEKPLHRPIPGWFLWATWLVGPGSYGMAFLAYVVFPEYVYGHPDPGPDVLLACVMVVTHGVAGSA